jgi:hypothetical protein
MVIEARESAEIGGRVARKWWMREGVKIIKSREVYARALREIGDDPGDRVLGRLAADSRVILRPNRPQPRIPVSFLKKLTARNSSTPSRLCAGPVATSAMA